jgi:serine/threonine-protein kinase RsbW
VTGAYPVLPLRPADPVRSARPWARTFRGTPASVSEARRFASELLAGCPARETLIACVSELCANAVAHTASGNGGVFIVEVDCSRAGVARVAITDEGSDSVPAAGVLDLLAEGGRGLAMVAACTSRWGFADAYPGRTVWAEATWPVAVPSPGHMPSPGPRPRRTDRSRRFRPPSATGPGQDPGGAA